MGLDPRCGKGAALDCGALREETVRTDYEKLDVALVYVYIYEANVVVSHSEWSDSNARFSAPKADALGHYATLRHGTRC